MIVTYLYQWATIGGVERVILNRALALKILGVKKYKFRVLYIQDAGGLNSFKRFIDLYDLNDIIVEVGILNKHLLENNSLYSVIDTPGVIKTLNKYNKPYFVECHTPYIQNRQYLKNLDSDVLVAVPSNHFRETVINEAPHIKNVLVLRTPIQSEKPHKEITLPKYKGRILAYIGRMDELKNFIYILDAFEKLVYDFHKDGFYLLLVGPYSIEYNIYKELSKRRILNKTILLPAVGFDKTNDLLRALKKDGALVVSASKGESFGLSSAEAILCDVPVLLSDITAHRYLVKDNQQFLFKLDNCADLAKKIINIDTDFETYKHSLLSEIKPFIQKITSNTVFMQDFIKVLEKISE